MKIKEIAFICYPATSLKRAQKFYEGILGLKATSTWVKNDKSGMIEYNIGKEGCLAIGAGAGNFNPGKHGPSAALEVEDFEKSVAVLKKNKVKMLMEPMDTGVCQMVLVEDPDGNQIMIHKRKPKKKSKK